MSAIRPRVSIGLPVYNGADLLPGALDCLLGQTYEDFELVISDNGSTDDTPHICRVYQSRDKRVRYHRQAANLGAVRNFNRVFELSRGTYFRWAGHDDLCSPTLLARCVEVLDEHPDVVWCHSRSTHIEIGGDVIDEPELQDVSYAAQASKGPNRESPRPHQRLQGVMLGKGGCLDAFGLMRAAVVRDTPLYLPCYGSEKVFIAELALRGRYREIPETLFFPRVHSQASSALTTAAEQNQHTDPKDGGVRFTRLRLLAGYLRAIARADLAPTEQALCLGVVGRYLLQVHKWGKVIRKTVSGIGVGGDNAAVVDKLRHKEAARSVLPAGRMKRA
jgi:hypothetical protein